VTQVADEPEPLLEAENPTTEVLQTNTVKTEAATAEKKPKSTKTSMLRTLLLVLLVVSLVGSGIAATLWRDQVASDLEKQQTDNIASLAGTIRVLQSKLVADNTTANQTNDVPVAPSAAVIENIKSAIISGNTAALEGYMADSVDVADDFSVATASTPSVATASITSEIASATAPWNFALSASILSSYGSSSFGKYFPSSAVVGKSSNNKVISFSFNSDAKISAVLLIADETKLQ
jgi:hypothetical protein